MAEGTGTGRAEMKPGDPISTSDALAGMSLVQQLKQHQKKKADLTLSAGKMIMSALAGMAGYYAGSLGARYGKEETERRKIVESKRVQRTADAKAMSKKNLVFAFVELGRQFDESANVIVDLRSRLDALHAQWKNNQMGAKNEAQALAERDRARNEIRKMRALLAHYLESEVGA